MPFPLDLPDNVFKEKDGRWIRYCPKCDKEISHLRRNYCIGANNIKQPCKKCSNISNHPSGMIGSVRLAWFESFRKSAITRGYSWEITPEDVDALYNLQNQRCAFSGIIIGWSVVGWEHSASIDRIDNDKGYTLDNIQLVHKKVNMMRGTLEVEEFLDLCESIANHSKTKW
jgi:hypothetical protein